MSHQKTPLAERMRPKSLDEFWGQEQITAKASRFRSLIKSPPVPSMIFWGPPGTGKTTLAHLVAKESGASFHTLSAVFAGVKDLRTWLEKHTGNLFSQNRPILFVDEIHRWNKAQQDALLPHIENGSMTLLGATTENPSFELNPALLSRTQVVPLEKHSVESLTEITKKGLEYLSSESGGGSPKKKPFSLSDQALKNLLYFSEGDARKALNLIENAVYSLEEHHYEIDEKRIEEIAQRKMASYRKGGDAHFDLISAFIKSMRGSDPDAAVYYLARMLDGGEDPLFIARRMVVFASEDIGNADPKALPLASSVASAVQLIGMPECRINLSHGATYLAAAPKSNASYQAVEKALSEVRNSGELAVPAKLRNAPTKLMKDMGYGRAYVYPHEKPKGYATSEEYLPPEIKDRKFYNPKEIGFETKIKERLEYLKGAGDRNQTPTAD
jgi:putative ATPase